MGSCLAFLAQESHDLARIVEAWVTLPKAVRDGILALVEAATASRSAEGDGDGDARV